MRMMPSFRRAAFSLALTALFLMASLGWAVPVACATAAPVFTASATLRKGAAPTEFRVYATEESLPGFEGDPVYRIEYTRTQGGAATQPLLFACLGGTEELDMLRFVDVNMDGWLDIEALYVPGATNVACTYFINGGENESFYEAPILSELSWYDLYPKQRLIVNFQHDSAMTGLYTLYRWPQGAALPTKYRVASYLDDEQSNGQAVRDFVAQYNESGGETIMRDVRWSRDISQEEWLAHEQERMGLFWQGLDSAETPLAQQLYVNPQGGRYYHAKAQCESISPKYYAGMKALQRGQLNDAAYEELTPCPVCCKGEEIK